MKNFENLRAILKILGITQSDFAEMCGYTRQNLSMVLNGKVKLRKVHILAAEYVINKIIQATVDENLKKFRINAIKTLEPDFRFLEWP